MGANELSLSQNRVFNKKLDERKITVLLKKYLSKNKPVLLAVNWSTKLWTNDSSLNKNILSLGKSTAERPNLELETFLHEVVITGIHLNRDGSIKYLELQNSIGSYENSKLGIDLMTMDYFYKYAQRLSFLKLRPIN